MAEHTGRLYWAGLAFLLLSILLNEWFLQTLWKGEVFWSVGDRVKTWLLQFSLLATGAWFLVLHRKSLTPASFLKWLLRGYPRTAAFVIGLLLVLILLTLVKVAGRQSTPDPSVAGMYLDGQLGMQGFAIEDELLGYKPRSRQKVRVRKEVGRAILYDVTYTIDELSRRLTPGQQEDATRFLLFSGCSFAFGEGVNDEETLAYHLAQLAPKTRTYNYGFAGYGAQQTLALLEGRPLAAEIGQKRGHFIYVFLVFHVGRTIGSPAVFNGWGAFMPFYTLDSSGKVRRQGNFTSGRPWISLLFWFSSKLGLGHPPAIVHSPESIPDQLELTARIISRAAETFASKFPESRFLVLVYPQPLGAYDLRPNLRALGVPFLDYSDLFRSDDRGLHIPDDGHPTGQAYRMVAEKLAVDLGLIGER